MSDNIDTLLDELSSFSLPVDTRVPIRNTSNINEENINEYIMKRASQLIDTSIDAVENIKDYVVQGQNPDELAALSELVNSVSKAIDTLNKINLQNKKAKTDKELKTMELQNRKEVAGMLPGNNVTNNTVNLVASREEIFKKLLINVEPEPVEIIDSTIVDENEDK